MYKKDLALNNLLWLICYKNLTKPNCIFVVSEYQNLPSKLNFLNLNMVSFKKEKSIRTLVAEEIYFASIFSRAKKI